MDIAYSLDDTAASVIINLDDPGAIVFATNDLNLTPLIDPTILLDVPTGEPPVADPVAVDEPDPDLGQIDTDEADTDPPIDPDDDSIVPFSALMRATDDQRDQFFFGTKAQSHAAPTVANFDAGNDIITLDHHFYADASLIAYHDGELSYDGKVIAHFDGAPDITSDLISII